MSALLCDRGVGRGRGVSTAASGAAGVLLAFVSFIQPAPGEVTYLSQMRSVGGKGWDTFSMTMPPYWGWLPNESEIKAPDFGPFIENWSHGASALQNSTLGATAISAIGSATATNLFWKNGKLAEGTPYCIFTASFSIDEPTPFSLTGTLKMQEPYGFGGSANVSLSGPGLSLIYTTVKPEPNGWKHLVEFSDQGVLQPGTYSVSAQTGAWTGDYTSSTNSFQFTLAIPAPGAGIAGGAGVLGWWMLAGRRRR